METLIEEIRAELARASVDKKHPWHYPTLATLQNGVPEQRTLVLRVYHSKEEELILFTDFRSPKVAQIQASPTVSIHFYNPRKQWQVRVIAEAEIHNQNAFSQSFLSKIPPNARVDYRTFLKPGADKTAKGPLASAEENFTALVLKIKTIDSLELSRDGHRRFAIDLEANQIKEIQA